MDVGLYTSEEGFTIDVILFLAYRKVSGGDEDTQVLVTMLDVVWERFEGVEKARLRGQRREVSPSYS